MRAFALLLLATFSLASFAALAQTKEFVGSAACELCHPQIYERWQQTRMANVVQEVATKPAAVLGDFGTPNPLVTFSLADVVFTYGSRWKQRYFTKRGDDYFVFPAQWDVQNRQWRRYDPSGEWWARHYPADQMQRPTGPLCDGCHSTNYDVRTKSVTEWNVGCEKCHGAGGAHVQQPTAANIVNPARLDYVRGNDVCISCHSQGQPLANPIEGKFFDWPVGYEPGQRLRDVWTLEEHMLGEETSMFFPDGSAHKNRMQGNDFVQSVMYERGVRCFNCHDVHGTEHAGDVVRQGNAVCLTCHGPQTAAGPRGSIEEHVGGTMGHALGSQGAQCVGCHMPAIATTIGNVRVRSHTFRVLTPALTEHNKMPNSCTSCHVDRDAAWAAEQLRQWPGVSPWRVAP